MDFSERLKKLRKDKGLTQESLGKALKKSRSTIAGYEAEGKIPDPETLKILADFFKVTIDYLLGHDDKTSATVDVPDIPGLPEIPEGIPFKPTSRDKKQWKELLQKGGQAFFYNDDIDEEDKKEMLDILTEFFIDAKVKNKVKYGRKNKKESEVIKDGGNA